MARRSRIDRLIELLLFRFYANKIRSTMGGGNAQKSAMSRQKNADKKSSEGKGGGGKAAMEARKGGDMSSAMEAAAAERAAVKAKREAKVAAGK